VVDVELLQLDLTKNRNLGFYATLGAGNAQPLGQTTDKDGKVTTGPISSVTMDTLSTLSHIGNYSFTIPTAVYAAAKSVGNTQLLANPELRISEGEKATLHIGQRIPVPVTTFTTGVQTGTFGSLPATSYQYQDVGIKVAIEPRVHHNREVTLKLTVEVSNKGADAPGTGSAGVAAQPTFITRTIESTIRLKDGETNFLAGLIQQTENSTEDKTPFLGDLPIIGRLFSKVAKDSTRTDLILTMTPHIIRVPDITDDDLAPMWVGTTNNLTFRGLSPRLESRTNVDPFQGRDPNAGLQLAPDGEPGNYIRPEGQPQPATTRPVLTPPAGLPNDPFRRQPPAPPVVPPPQQPPVPESRGTRSQSVSEPLAVADEQSGLTPRIGPQPMRLSVKPGEEKIWTIVGMDLDGLTAKQILLHFDPHTLDVSEVSFGSAMQIDLKTPPVVNIDRGTGTIKITSSDGGPLRFNSGGDLAALRVRGVLNGETYLVLENPDLKNGTGKIVASTIAGGHAKVE